MRQIFKTVNRTFRHIMAVVSVYLILAFLHIMRPIKPVTILLLTEARIGEFAPRTDLYLRKLQSPDGEKPLVLSMAAFPHPLKPLPKGLNVAISDDPCNEHLLTMFKRHIYIWRTKFLSRVINHNMSPGSDWTNKFKSSQFVYRLPIPTIDDYQLSEGPVALTFTEEEEIQGQELLQRMGIPKGSWFVCFHARDSAYLTNNFPERDLSFTDCRDCSIDNYASAMRYVVARGGYAVRMGSDVQSRMANAGEPGIIDYAHDYHSDFGDIYLFANCKFFVGNHSGVKSVPIMFNVPIIEANCLLMPVIPPSYRVEFLPNTNRDLFIPKEMFSKEKNRVLTLREYLDMGVQFLGYGYEYEELGLTPIENTSEEILTVTMEMNERLDGSFIYTDEDEVLQTKFRSLIHPNVDYWDHLPRIGAAVLRSQGRFLE